MPGFKPQHKKISLVIIGAVLIVFMGVAIARQFANPANSRVITQKEAASETFDWGTFYTYQQGETYGTKDGLTGVAVIKPGIEIHPPHQHAEEEYLMVTEGKGIWHLNSKEFAATSGDLLYAAPWEIHGIKNTGAAPLTFVVWKWNNKGIALPAKPAEGN